MSTSLRQLTNRIEDLYIDSFPDAQTPPSRRVKSIGTPHSPPSSPIASSSRNPSTPSPSANMTSVGTPTTSPLLRLSTSLPPEMAVKERDNSADDDTLTFRTHSFSSSMRFSRASSYNPKQWRSSSSSFQAEGVEKFATIRNSIEDHLFHRGYLNGVCSDISINTFGKSYALHRIILDRSPFFSSLFAGPWRDADIPVLDLDFSDPNIFQASFDIAIQRLYGHIIVPEEDVVSNLLATAAYLDLQDLVEECLNTLLRTLNPKNVSKRYQFARGRQYYGEGSEKLAEACYTLLCHAGSSMLHEQWDGIPNEVAAEVISSDAFWVEGEYERYCFARDFIKRRRSQEVEDIQVLEQVLLTGIYYLHLPFETLQQILSDTEDGKPVVPPGVIHNALWQQTNLRQIIVSADTTNPSLNLTTEDGWTVPSKDTMTDPFNSEEDAEIVPVLTEKMGSEATSPIQVQETEEGVTTSSPFPPFRFSVEFRGIRAMTEGEKGYSRTVFYAGSHWRVYLLRIN
jgi:BTB/POZ domain